jgi:hypothetical protein
MGRPFAKAEGTPGIGRSFAGARDVESVAEVGEEHLPRSRTRASKRRPRACVGSVRRSFASVGRRRGPSQHANRCQEAERERTRSHEAFYRGRKAAGRADGRRPGSFRSRVLNRRGAGRPWRSGDALGLTKDRPGAAGAGRSSRVGAVERQGTSEVVCRWVGLPQPKGAGGLQPPPRKARERPRERAALTEQAEAVAAKNRGTSDGTTAARTVGPDMRS